MREEEEKDSLFVCVQRWLENLPQLADFPEKYEKAINEMMKKKRNGITDGDKAGIERWEKVYDYYSITHTCNLLCNTGKAMV